MLNIFLMRKVFVLFILFNILYYGYSQPSVYKFRISFKDKNNSIYNINNPTVFLSNKAVNRRLQFGIPIDEKDIPVNSFYIDSILNYGVQVINQSRWFNSVIASVNDTSMLDVIRNLSFVKNIEPVISFAKKKSTKPTNINKNINFYLQAYNSEILNNSSLNLNSFVKIQKVNKNLDYGQAFNQINILNGIPLHAQGFQGQGMVIAVLDAGFWKVDMIDVFDSLWLNGQILGTKDFVQPGNNVFNESTHGMMVLSTMAANKPGEMIGTAPKAEYWLIRTEDAASENIIEEDNWATGAEFADSVGADIINSSLGYTTFDDPNMNHTYLDMNGKNTRVTQAATIAARKGILVVNSAGNSGGMLWKYIGAPADADSIITVGAVDESGKYAIFSSMGPTVDNRVKPTVMSMGEGSTVAYDGGITNGNGTSFAAPILCGMTACLWQAFPQKSNQEIIEAIKISSSQYSYPDSLMGYGIPNFPVAAILLSGNLIHNFDIENEFNVFPNPFHDDLYIAYNSSDTQKVSVQIFEISGKCIFEISEIPRMFGYNSLTINNLNLLNNGIYIVRITSGNKTSTKKVLKY